MAKIPVERESSGGGWWKWLLGLAAIVLAVWIIWAIASPEDQDDFAIGDEMMQDGTEQQADSAAMGAGLITDASMITQAQDQGRLVGRQVHLTNMRVERVQGDSILFVTSDQPMQNPRDEDIQPQPDDGMQTPQDQDMQTPGEGGMQTQPDDGMQAPQGNDMQMQTDDQIIVAGIDRAAAETTPGAQDQADIEEGQLVTVIGSIERMQQDQPGSWGINGQEGDQIMEEKDVYVRARRLQVTDPMQTQPQPATAL